MTLPLLGTAEGVSEEEAKGPAIALGIALQLTNILRDVGEDLERGRIYLPLDEVERFGLTGYLSFWTSMSSHSHTHALTHSHTHPITTTLLYTRPQMCKYGQRKTSLLVK